jgi:hypothetical protein
MLARNPSRAALSGFCYSSSYPKFITRSRLHLIVDDPGELLPVCLTPGNVEDRQQVPRPAKKLWGKLCGDRGYLSQRLFEQLFKQDLQLITPSARMCPTD